MNCSSDHCVSLWTMKFVPRSLCLPPWETGSPVPDSTKQIFRCSTRICDAFNLVHVSLDVEKYPPRPFSLYSSQVLLWSLRPTSPSYVVLLYTKASRRVHNRGTSCMQSHGHYSGREAYRSSTTPRPYLLRDDDAFYLIQTNTSNRWRRFEQQWRFVQFLYQVGGPVPTK